MMLANLIAYGLYAAMILGFIGLCVWAVDSRARER